MGYPDRTSASSGQALRYASLIAGDIKSIAGLPEYPERAIAKSLLVVNLFPFSRFEINIADTFNFLDISICLILKSIIRRLCDVK